MSTNSGNIKLAEIKMIEKYIYALSLHILNGFHFLTIYLKVDLVYYFFTCYIINFPRFL